jgi:hypothetical protein
MGEIIVSLSRSGLENLLLVHPALDFEFIVNGVSSRCSSLVAAFISPKIAHALALDSTLDSYELTTHDTSEAFREFLTLGQTGSVTIGPTSLDFFCSVAQELENTEIYNAVLESFSSDPTSDTVYDRFQVQVHYGLSPERELLFLASHFFELPDCQESLPI